MSSYRRANPSDERPGPGSKGGPPGAGSKWVLVVDDEPAIREVLARTLSAEGYLVDVAADGEEAWQATHTRRYDGFITDLKMPKHGGQEFWERLNAKDKSLARRVIFMTGDTASHESRGFIPASGRPLVEKPFDLVELQLEVRRVLEGTSAGDQND